MDNYINQKFNIDYLKIGVFPAAGVLQIGTVGKIRRATPSVYAQHTSLSGFTFGIPVATPAVPLQSPSREKKASF